MSTRTLAAKLDRIARTARRRAIRHWSFVLLGDQELTPEQRAQIGPEDTVYIRRIHLTHEAYNLV